MRHILLAIGLILVGLISIPVCDYDATGGIFLIILGVSGLMTELSSKEVEKENRW